ncbi:formylglycine-generating enzyme family protein [Oscillochloris sp. ZM17-4]|uniref:formylglycine-generating enzyme family protein n=1 Tax=Oscillochloris sp. ZM17-4 TaxID=2866714 RepID=UPI001C72FD89|nr:SUMF1/EgtB/PvdO family nonheme iron enzyme [Oscillochloris sp. ZM17-4]MBX0330063.1 formylglycine-generating enzyme family protein [Oscillochloris sp. ZM17-4]
MTNVDYARFLAANGPDGYDPDKPWWTTHGRTYLLPGGYRFEGEPAQITHPRYWSVARYNGPLQPVVGVTWYEAAAYCRWLTAEGHTSNWLPQDQEIRLPTWLEWQRAARHTDQRRHPWGTEPPDPERANYQDTGIGAPSPIGSFPLGTAVCGVQDMLGNVIEWTATPDAQPGQTAPEKDFTQSDIVVVSWNSWAQGIENLCCGARDRDYPVNGIYYRSFRVVQSLRAHK